MNNLEQLKIAESYLGKGGSVFRKYCGLGAGQPYCCAFVVTIFAKAGNSTLFCDSNKVVYCPTAMKWCRENLASIPLYLAMPSDVIFFDWQPNEVPDHIGFVRERLTCDFIGTIEGNTNGGIVANKTRKAEDVQAIFRPHFKATFDTSKELAVDGRFGYNSIAMLQLALGIDVDGVLGKVTVKALQNRVGVTPDGQWGVNTSKAVQRMVGVTADGYFGEDSVKALQKWINAHVMPKPVPQPQPQPTPQKVVVDGYMGEDTVKATQKLLGTVQDGVISGQIKANQKYYPNITAVTFGGGKSVMVERLQRWLGVYPDGILGVNTIKAWQKKLGKTADGIFGAESVKAWQKYINEHDSIAVPAVTKSEQIASKASEFAYSTDTAKADYPKGKPTSAYKSGLNKAYPDRKKWSDAPKAGASCDVFVGTVLRNSVDKNFPRGLDEQMPYLAKHYTQVSNVHDGCIIVYRRNSGGGHICIYVDGKIKEASNSKYYPKTTDKANSRLSTKNKKWVKIYELR